MKAVTLLLALLGQAAAIELSKADWDAKTAGKSVFIKFFAPWCGHCKSMKPAWDGLMKEYEGHSSVLVADVDCTGAGKDVCESVGVKGFPTIKYGDPNNLEDYDGGRDAEALSKFAKENLGPTCGPAHLDLCDAEKKKQIDEFLAAPLEDLQAKITKQEALLASSDKELEELLKSLQSQYEAGQKKAEATKKEIKESGLGLMKSVHAHRSQQKKDEL